MKRTVVISLGVIAAIATTTVTAAFPQVESSQPYAVFMTITQPVTTMHDRCSTMLCPVDTVCKKGQCVPTRSSSSTRPDRGPLMYCMYGCQNSQCLPAHASSSKASSSNGKADVLCMRMLCPVNTVCKQGQCIPR